MRNCLLKNRDVRSKDKQRTNWSITYFNLSTLTFRFIYIFFSETGPPTLISKRMLIHVSFLVIFMFSWIKPAHEQAFHPFLYFSSKDVHRLREKAKTTHRDIFVRLRTAARRMKAEPSRFLPPTNWSVFALSLIHIWRCRRRG